DGFVILLVCAVLVSTALSLYLLLLAIASLRRLRQCGEPAPPVTRFAVIVPAHDEELVIGRLLGSINDLDYPRELLEVHVIADHCSDQTAAIAGSLGATVHEQRNLAPRGKSQALHWMVQHLLAGKAGTAIDA